MLGHLGGQAAQEVLSWDMPTMEHFSKCKLVAKSAAAAVKTGSGQGVKCAPRAGMGLCPLLQPAPGGPDC